MDPRLLHKWRLRQRELLITFYQLGYVPSRCRSFYLSTSTGGGVAKWIWRLSLTVSEWLLAMSRLILLEIITKDFKTDMISYDMIRYDIYGFVNFQICIPSRVLIIKGLELVWNELWKEKNCSAKLGILVTALADIYVQRVKKKFFFN